MNANQILSADLLDLVFDDRNKAYGAYDLRKTYPERIKKAMIVMFSLALLAFGGKLLAGTKNSDPKEKLKITTTILTEIPDDPEPPPPVEVKPPEPEPVRTEHLAAPVIVDDNQVEEPPPSQDDLKNAQIDVIKQDGVDFTSMATPANIDGDKGIIEAKKDPEPEIYTVVQVEASFAGDWRKYLERNLNPSVPVDNEAPAGSYRVVIQFVVDIDGNISNIVPQTNMGYGMEKEAIRVIKKSDKWKPAIQNGHPVKAYRSQSILFNIE